MDTRNKDEQIESHIQILKLLNIKVDTLKLALENATQKACETSKTKLVESDIETADDFKIHCFKMQEPSQVFYS
jgi:hypothetical protein